MTGVSLRGDWPKVPNPTRFTGHFFAFWTISTDKLNLE